MAASDENRQLFVNAQFISTDALVHLQNHEVSSSQHLLFGDANTSEVDWNLLAGTGSDGSVHTIDSTDDVGVALVQKGSAGLEWIYVAPRANNSQQESDSDPEQTATIEHKEDGQMDTPNLFSRPLGQPLASLSPKHNQRAKPTTVVTTKGDTSSQEDRLKGESHTGLSSMRILFWSFVAGTSVAAVAYLGGVSFRDASNSQRFWARLSSLWLPFANAALKEEDVVQLGSADAKELDVTTDDAPSNQST